MLYFCAQNWTEPYRIKPYFLYSDASLLLMSDHQKPNNQEPNNSMPTKKVGKYMMIIGWLMLLGLLTLTFGNWEEDQYNPNQHVDSTIGARTVEVILEQNAFNHYVSNGKINDKNVVFMLDTGATSVAVPVNLAQKLNLQKGRPYQVSTANGNSTAFATRIDSLQIGAIVLYDVKAAIATGMTGNQILLGMSALKELDIHQRGKQLTLTQHK